MTVSVVIPVFNDAAGVLRCLRGLAAQSYPASCIEVVVVDNGSTSRLSIDEEFPFGLSVIHCEERGSYAARNAGVIAASGSLLAFIDADCWPDADWLRSGIDALTAKGDSRVVGGDVRFAMPDRPSAVALYQLATGFGQEGNVRDKGFSATANLFCTRRQFDSVGMFDTRLLSGGDREWCWRAGVLGLSIHYEARAVVHTLPRGTLRGAMRQARRVVAGRSMLRGLGLTHVGEQALRKARPPLGSAIWILTRSGLRVRDRLRVLGVAVLIHAAAMIERVRLAVGAEPERR